MGGTNIINSLKGTWSIEIVKQKWFQAAAG